MTIYLVTTNQKKLLTAQKVLDRYGIDLQILSLEYEAPEIQSLSVEEIAGFSAQYVANKEQKAILLTDVGYFVRALNGFPGPFIKHMNHFLTSQDFLNLMSDKEDRFFEMRECLAFCQPGSEPVLFSSTNCGMLSTEQYGEGSSLNKIMIREGLEKVESLYSQEFMIDYYSKHFTQYDQFGQYYKESLL